MQNEEFDKTLATDSCKEVLKDEMQHNAAEAEAIYRKAIDCGCQNEQFFMDWQDRLNQVSFVHEEDLS